MLNPADDFFSDLNFELGEAGQGKILLSEPFLYDPSFRRSVVLLVEHNDEGSVGFILNKPIEMDISEALDNFPKFESSLYFGGPVNQNNLFYLHCRGDLITDSKEVIPGVFWGGDFETVKLLIDTGQIDQDEIQFFAGYSGWDVEQLQEELKENSWIVTDGDAETVFRMEREDMWTEIMSGLGKKYAVMATFPEDPSLN